MPDDRLSKKIMFGELRCGKRLHGGPKERYKDTSKEALKSFSVNPDTLEVAAQDCSNWRMLYTMVRKIMKLKEPWQPRKNGKRGKQTQTGAHPLPPSPAPNVLELSTRRQASATCPPINRMIRWSSSTRRTNNSM